MSHQEPSSAAKPSDSSSPTEPVGARARAEQAIAEFHGKFFTGGKVELQAGCKDAFIRLIVARGFKKTARVEEESVAKKVDESATSEKPAESVSSPITPATQA